MKIMTHDSLKASGGINRRLREIRKYYSMQENYSFVVLKLDKEDKFHCDGNFQDYHIKLPDCINGNFPYEGLTSEKQVRTRFASLSDKIDQIVAKEQPDVFLIMGTFFLPWAILQSAKMRNKPVALLYIGSAITEFYPPEGLLPVIYKPLEEEFLDYSAYTIFNSHKGLEKVKELFGRIPQPNSIIWNGVPLELFDCKPNHKREGIGYVARYDRFKNPSILLDIDKELKRQDKTVKFHILSNLHQGIPLYHDCLNAGFSIQQQTKDDKQLQSFYQSRVGVISPSKFETFGNVSLESLAVGVPCLVSSGIGASEVFLELRLNNLLFNPDDTSEICEKVISLNHTKSVIGDSIRKKLMELCNWRTVINEYMSIMGAL